MQIKIPIYSPFLEGNEKKYVNECLDSSWISSKGQFVDRFSSSFAEFIKVDYASTVCNGTVAIHLALVALGIREGDEIIVPTLTYIASVNAISYTGASPIFVDSVRSTWQMDPEDIKRKITKKTKAILVVHLYGHPCEMNSICEIAKEHGLYVVEDCAEAFGSYYEGKHVGSFGDISTFSFFGNKSITTGEGGMVVTNNVTLYDRVMHFKGQGLAKHRQYWHDVIGYNYRMTNICAAIGLAQLENASLILKKKIQIANWYKESLKEMNIEFHTEASNVKHSYWMNSILVRKPIERDELMNYLSEHGIETRPVFYPIHTMPMYSKEYSKFTVAEDIGWRGINLPSFPALNKDNVDYILMRINEFYK